MIMQSEKEILISIGLNNNSGRILVSSPKDIVSEYFIGLLNSLVGRGYLTGNEDDGYQLTAMGQRTLIELLLDDEKMTKTASEKLSQLGREGIDKLARLKIMA